MGMSAIAVPETDHSTAGRYEALIRIANSIRARQQPQELFEILVHELSRVVQFDGIAQFDESANKVNWHLGPECSHREHRPSEVDRDEHSDAARAG